MLLLFSSDSRVLYADDVMRAIIQPHGSKLEFRYRERWVENKVFEQGRDLVGKKALIVYIEKASIDAFTMPIRLAYIKDVRYDGPGIDKSETKIYLDLMLDSFVTPTAKYFDYLSKNRNNLPVRNPKTGEVRGYFMVNAPDEIVSIKNPSQAWISMVVNLQKGSKTFADRIFYTISCLQDSEGTIIPYTYDYGYEVHSNNIYNLFIYNRNTNNDIFDPFTIQVSVENLLIARDALHFSDESSIVFNSNNMFTPIPITVDGPISTYTLNIIDDYNFIGSDHHVNLLFTVIS